MATARYYWRAVAWRTVSRNPTVRKGRIVAGGTTDKGSTITLTQAKEKAARFGRCVELASHAMLDDLARQTVLRAEGRLEGYDRRGENLGRWAGWHDDFGIEPEWIVCPGEKPSHI